MKRINKILCGIAVCASALAISSCKTETVYVMPDDNSVSRLSVYPRSVNMEFVDNTALEVTIRPSNAKYTWTSEDESIAVVDANDCIVPKGLGTTTLTAKAGYKTYSVTVTVRSAIVGDYFFIENGQTAKMDNIKVLPEGTPFEVTNKSESMVSVTDDLTVSALQSGVASITIKTEDNSKDISIGVVESTTTLASGQEFIYDGAELGHGNYGFSVLTFGTSDAVYEGDAKWSGSGKGLAYKLYRNSDFETAPDGTYTPGEDEFNFFSNDNTSYIVDAATGTKEYIKYGNLTIDGDNVTANIITTSNAYVFKYSGARPTTARALQTEYITNIDADYCTGTCQTYMDTGGTVFFGGYTYMGEFRLANSSSNYYLQLFAWCYQSVINGDYTMCSQWGGRGTCWVYTNGYTSYREGNSRYYLDDANGGFTISDYEESGSTVTASIKGTVYGASDYTYTVAEIGLQNSIPHIINIDVTNQTFNVSSSRLSQ